MNEPNGWRWLPLTVGVIVLDQFTKLFIVKHFDLYERIAVLPVLDITRLHNTGAAFSMLADASGWQRWFFTLLAIVVGVGIIAWLGKLKARSQWVLCCGFSLILAGALGNLIDRLRLGHVIDFIHAHWDEHYFAAFNIADSAITIGAVMILIDALFESRRGKAARNSESPPANRRADGETAP